MIEQFQKTKFKNLQTIEFIPSHVHKSIRLVRVLAIRWRIDGYLRKSQRWKVNPPCNKHGIFPRRQTILLCQGCRGDKNCKANFYGLGRTVCQVIDPSTNAHEDILGITLDPNFATNHFVYAYIIVKDNNTGTISSRVIRFTELDSKATDPKILIDNIPTRDGAFLAGGLVFGPDDKLYVATGILIK